MTVWKACNSSALYTRWMFPVLAYRCWLFSCQRQLMEPVGWCKRFATFNIWKIGMLHEMYVSDSRKKPQWHQVYNTLFCFHCFYSALWSMLIEIVDLVRQLSLFFKKNTSIIYSTAIDLVHLPNKALRYPTGALKTIVILYTTIVLC